MTFKKTFTIFVLALLLANSFVVSALAQPCAYAEKGTKVMEMSNDVPCHKANESAKSLHCEGKCFCAHVTFSGTMNVLSTQVFNHFQLWPEKYATKHEVADSFALKPVQKPPLVTL